MRVARSHSYSAVCEKTFVVLDINQSSKFLGKSAQCLSIVNKFSIYRYAKSAKNESGRLGNHFTDRTNDETE